MDPAAASLGALGSPRVTLPSGFTLCTFNGAGGLLITNSPKSSGSVQSERGASGLPWRGRGLLRRSSAGAGPGEGSEGRNKRRWLPSEPTPSSPAQASASRPPSLGTTDPRRWGGSAAACQGAGRGCPEVAGGAEGVKREAGSTAPPPIEDECSAGRAGAGWFGLWVLGLEGPQAGKTLQPLKLFPSSPPGDWNEVSGTFSPGGGGAAVAGSGSSMEGEVTERAIAGRRELLQGWAEFPEEPAQKRARRGSACSFSSSGA